MTSSPPPSRRRTSGWVVGRVAGAPVVLSPSWLLSIVVLTLLASRSVRFWVGDIGAGVYLVSFGFVALLFASVFLHEVAHGLMGRARGQHPHELVLTLWGGRTTFHGESTTPATSALVAIVGPVVNLVLAALFGLAWSAVRDDPGSTVLAALLASGAITNGFVGLFNLVPGLPLDGGYVLEALVWAVTKNRHTGTVVAGWCGRAVAVGVLAWAFLSPALSGRSPDVYDVLIAALVGAFLWTGASGAVRGGRTQRAVEEVTFAAVGRPAITVGHAASVAQAGAAAAAAGVSEVVVVSPDGRPAAYVDAVAAGSVPPAVAGTTPVTAVSVPLPVGASVDAGLTGGALVRAVGEATRHSPVVAALVDGRVVGLIRATDVVAAIRR